MPIISIENITNKDCYKYYHVKKDVLKSLGMKTFAIGKFDKLNDIFNNDLGFVLGQSIDDHRIMSPRHSKFKLGNAYVMTLSTFLQARREKMFKPFRKTFNELYRPYRGQDLNGKKILISRTGGLGDIVITQSVLKAIKDKYPTCKIVYTTSYNFIDLFRCFPLNLIDEVGEVPFDKEIMENCDYHLFFINAIENCIETQKMNYYDIFQKISHIDYDSSKYISELKPLKNEKDILEKLILPNTILLHAESTTKLRTADIRMWLSVINTLLDRKFNIGIIDSPNKANAIDDFIAKSGLDVNRVQNLSKFSKTVSLGVAITDCCKAVMCIDSAFAHIAGALKKPTVCVCGPYPDYNVTSKYETVFGLSAKPGFNSCGLYPCHFNSQENLCPYLVNKKVPGCLDSITSNMVLDAFDVILEKCKN